jgi:hypothetical protein
MCGRLILKSKGWDIDKKLKKFFRPCEQLLNFCLLLPFRLTYSFLLLLPLPHAEIVIFYRFCLITHSAERGLGFWEKPLNLFPLQSWTSIIHSKEQSWVFLEKRWRMFFVFYLPPFFFPPHKKNCNFSPNFFHHFFEERMFFITYSEKWETRCLYLLYLRICSRVNASYVLLP